MTTKDLTAKLLTMKERVSQAEIKVSQLEGRLQGLYERLKKEYGIDSLEAANQMLTKLDKELTDKENVMAVEIGELEIQFSKLEETM